MGVNVPPVPPIPTPLSRTMAQATTVMFTYNAKNFVTVSCRSDIERKNVVVLYVSILHNDALDSSLELAHITLVTIRR